MRAGLSVSHRFTYLIQFIHTTQAHSAIYDTLQGQYFQACKKEEAVEEVVPEDASKEKTSGASSASVNIFLGASLAALLLLPATLKNYC